MKTNFDTITESTEKLAKAMVDITTFTLRCPYSQVVEEWVKWLNSPAKEESTRK